MQIRKSYSLDDVLLVPKYSEILHRADVDTSVDLGRGVKLGIPILSANMVHCTGPEMARTMAELGGMGVLHRFNNHRYGDYLKASAGLDNPNIAISVGITESEQEQFRDIVYQGDEWKIVCIDVAHGHHIKVKEMIQYVRDTLPNALIIAGNVATGPGAVFLADAGVDVIKAGIGQGSTCSTRIATGNGVGSLTALEDCRDALDKAGHSNIKLVADGGIKAGGDVIKCLCFADAVMIGNLLAGTDQAPGDIIMINGKKYKQYAGSSTLKKNNVEGVSGYVPYRGNVRDVISQLMDGVRSGCSYQGVRNLEDLKINPEFVEISNSGLVESKPHDIII